MYDKIVKVTLGTCGPAPREHGDHGVLVTRRPHKATMGFLLPGAKQMATMGFCYPAPERKVTMGICCPAPQRPLDSVARALTS